MTVIPMKQPLPETPQWAIDRARRIVTLLPALDGSAAEYIAAQLALAEQEGCTRGVQLAIEAVQRAFKGETP